MNRTAPPEKVSPSLSLLSRVVRHEILQRPGVARVGFGFPPRRGGVRVNRDARGALHIHATIVVRYGHAVRTVGRLVQRAAVEAIQRVSGQPVAEVRVAVAGVALARHAAGQEVRS